MEKSAGINIHPVVRESWENDLDNHIDFDGWQFISRGEILMKKSIKTSHLLLFSLFRMS